MPEENTPKKVKLRKAETNRMKVETGPHRKEGTAPGAPKISVAPKNVRPPAPASDDAPTAEVSSPMSRRQTSHNKLRRVPSTPAEADGGIGEGKNATVRLKVVRDSKKSMMPSPLSAAQADVPEIDPAPTTVAPVPEALAQMKKGTSTLRVEPKLSVPSTAEDESPGGTVRVAAPGRTQKVEPSTPYKNTNTSTIKLKLKSSAGANVAAEGSEQMPESAPSVPAASKNATATLKIRPAKPLEGAASGAKSASATLKIRPAGGGAGAPASTAEKSATATLKIRPGAAPAAAAASAGATVKIKPAALAGEKKSLKLKKTGSAAAGQQDVTISLPGVEAPAAPAAPPPPAAPAPPAAKDGAATVSVPPPAQDDASATVAVQPAAAAATGKKPSLKLKGGAGRTQAAKPVPAADGKVAPDAAAAVAPGLRPREEQTGGGAFTSICTFFAAAAAAVLVGRLGWDLMYQVLQ